MYKIGEDTMVSCPYNRYHIVSKLRIQKHIIKCKKNYPDVKLATCFYNYTHRLRPEDMLRHYEICSHKTRLDAAKYCEPFSFNNLGSFVENNFYSNKCPDIRIKPQFFEEPNTFSPSSNSNFGKKFDMTDSGSESDSQMKATEDEFSFDEDVSDDDMEPLPLPKTVSKAFVCVKQTPKDVWESSQVKSFGRGKNFVAFAKSKTSSPLSASTSTSDDMEDKIKTSNFLSRDSPCNMTITSSMFEDTSSFKSEEIIFDEDDEENSFIFKNFDKYVKI